MGSTKKNASWRTSAGAAVAKLYRLINGGRHPGVLIGIIALAAVVGAFYVRHRWPELLTTQQDIAITPDAFQITPPPPWIHADIKTEVVRDAHLTALHVLDRDLTARVAEAFAGHTWVEKVVRVSKQAGPRIEVELTYRRPAAMVEAVSAGEPYLLPIDEQSILLPTESFLGKYEDEARKYLRIAVPNSHPAGPIGTAWGDARVLGAARIAAAWLDHPWQSSGLYRIEIDRNETSDSKAVKHTYAICTRAGRRIMWGHAPGDEPAGEPKAAEKIARLFAHVKANGPLDEHGAGDIDLRTVVHAASLR